MNVPFQYGQHRYHANTDNADDAKDDPEHASAPCIGTGLDGKPCTQQDTWKADVKEVYFAGDHTVSIFARLEVRRNELILDCIRSGS